MRASGLLLTVPIMHRLATYRICQDLPKQVETCHKLSGIPYDSNLRYRPFLASSAFELYHARAKIAALPTFFGIPIPRPQSKTELPEESPCSSTTAALLLKLAHRHSPT